MFTQLLGMYVTEITNVDGERYLLIDDPKGEHFRAVMDETGMVVQILKFNKETERYEE